MFVVDKNLSSSKYIKNYALKMGKTSWGCNDCIIIDSIRDFKEYSTLQLILEFPGLFSR